MAQHKWHKEIKAWADGAEIEATIHCDKPNWVNVKEWYPKEINWDSDVFIFRIKPKSNWNKEKEAYDKGEKLEFKLSDEWHDWNYSFEPHWDIDEYQYRIKPQPKEPQYLYVYEGECSKSPIFTFHKSTEHYVNYIGKIKLEE